MQISLHKLARTTPAIRSEIQASPLKVKDLARKYGVAVQTIYKWKKRDCVNDLSHARHRSLSSLTREEEEIVKELRGRLELSIDDITEVMNRCINPSLSRSAIYRTLSRLGIGGRRQEADRTMPKRFEETTECGFIHMDVKHLTKLKGKRSYVYVAIDRATRYVYAEILYNLEPNTTAGFIDRFLKDFPHPVKVILSDNGFEWTDRCAGSVKKKPTGNHPVDRLCKHHNVEHRLTKIRPPQTNGMVERFNRRINEAIAKKAKVPDNQGKNTFQSHEQRNLFILQFVDNYNHTRLRCLNYKAPISLIRNNHPKHNTHEGGDPESGYLPGFPLPWE